MSGPGGEISGGGAVGWPGWVGIGGCSGGTVGGSVAKAVLLCGVNAGAQLRLRHRS
jgi:hypothetical protein